LLCNPFILSISSEVNDDKALATSLLFSSTINTLSPLLNLPKTLVIPAGSKLFPDLKALHAPWSI